MGTYINVKINDNTKINEINELWNMENSDCQDTFHLLNLSDAHQWIANIHSDEELKHLRHIETIENLNDTFPAMGLGTFQVKITMGDYLCADMAKRYKEFFTKYGDTHFVANPINDSYILETLNEAIEDNIMAKDCSVECPVCTNEELELSGI